MPQLIHHRDAPWPLAPAVATMHVTLLRKVRLQTLSPRKITRYEAILGLKSGLNEPSSISVPSSTQRINRGFAWLEVPRKTRSKTDSFVPPALNYGARYLPTAHHKRHAWPVPKPQHQGQGWLRTLADCCPPPPAPSSSPSFDANHNARPDIPHPHDQPPSPPCNVNARSRPKK